MSSQTPRPTKKIEATIIDNVFEKIKSVRTPIQLATFVLAVVLAIALFHAQLTTNVLALMILFLPFILLFLILNKKTLEVLAGGGHVILIIAVVLIVGSLVLSGYAGIALVKSSQEGLIQTSDSGLLEPNKKVRVEKIRDANFRLASYFDSYKLISGYYYQALMEAFDPNNKKDAYSMVALLRKELDVVIEKIVRLKGSTLNDVYGKGEINQEVLRLQESIMALDSTRYFWDVVLRIYGQKGETYQIDQIVDTKDWKLSQQQIAEIKQVRFSAIEADLIRALGRDIVVKPVNGFQTQDIDSVRAAMRTLGYLSESSNSQNNTDILNRYNGSISTYFDSSEQSQPFYKLASGGVESQIPIYPALYDTGLLDFKKFLLKYSPVNARPILLELMNRRISLFGFDDLNKMTEAMLQEKAGVKSAREQSNTLLFKIRDDMKERLGSSAEVEAVLSSSTVEDYFIRSLRLSLKKSANPDERDVFVNVSSFVFLGTTEVSSKYGQMLQELLSYYNVFETDLMIGALEN